MCVYIRSIDPGCVLTLGCVFSVTWSQQLKYVHPLIQLTIIEILALSWNEPVHSILRYLVSLSLFSLQVV